MVRRADPPSYRPPPGPGPGRSGQLAGLVARTQGTNLRQTALAFMRAWLEEDIEALMRLVSGDFALAPGNQGTSRRTVREAWQRQFARLDYTQFSLDDVVDPTHIEIETYEERQLHSPPRQGWLQPGDRLVRLPMQVTRRNRRRYFDDTIELWFRRDSGQWQIVALGR